MKRPNVSPIALIALGGILLIVLVLILGASGFSGVLPGNNAYQSKTDSGYYVFYRLLEELEYRVVFEKRYKSPAEDRSTIVYLDAPGEADFDTEEMYRWIRRGNTLVLIGTGADSFARADLVQFGEPRPVEFRDPRRGASGSFYASSTLPEEFFRSKKRWNIIAETSDGVVMGEIFLGEGRVLIIADRNLFDNRSMHNLQNALLLDSLFQESKGEALYLRERRAVALYDPSIVRELFSGRLQIFTLHFAVMFLLFLVLSGKRFSRPENPYGSPRRKITEHIRAVGIFFQNARAYDLIEQIDSDYLKTVVCRNRKPPEMTEEEFGRYTVPQEGLKPEEILSRFAERARLIRTVHGRKKTRQD